MKRCTRDLSLVWSLVLVALCLGSLVGLCEGARYALGYILGTGLY
ncbi:MAG: hypothetical protein AB8I08_40505 [Sandaracinaceae bacterium]